MRTMFKTKSFTSALALTAMAATPLAAQNSPMPDPTEMTAEQRAEFDRWPADKQAAYRRWPSETQGYYWSLSPERQALFWQLRDTDKIALTAMTGPERSSAWEEIESRAAPPSQT